MQKFIGTLGEIIRPSVSLHMGPNSCVLFRISPTSEHFPSEEGVFVMLKRIVRSYAAIDELVRG